MSEYELYNTATSAEKIHKIVEQTFNGMQERLRVHGEYSLRYIKEELYLAARNPKTLPKTLQMIAENWKKQDSVIYDVERHPNTPPDVLAMLAEKDPFGCASNPNTPPEVLAKMAKSKDAPEETRAELLKNPATPVEAINEMRIIAQKQMQEYAESKKQYLLVVAASSPFSDGETLRKVASQVWGETGRRLWKEEKAAQEALASNPNTPPEILLKLESYPHAQEALASHPNTPPEVLAKLAMEEKQRLTEALFANPSLPAASLAKWAENPDEWNRAASAQHPNTPPEVLAVLAEDKDEIVGQLARRRVLGKNTPVVVTQVAFGKERSVELGEHQYPVELARRVRALLTYNPQTSDWLETNQPVLDVKLKVYADYDAACLDEFEAVVVTPKGEKRILCNVYDTEGAGDVQNCRSDAYYTRLWQMWVALWGKKQKTSVVPAHCQIS